MITPPYLKTGDKVAIVSTARKVSAPELAFAIEQLKQWGLTVQTGNNIYCQDNQFAGTDEQRAADLQWAINDHQIKAVFFARGGYGTLRVMDRIDFRKLSENPKWMVGFSDITVLHSHLHKHFGLATLHAAMPFAFEKNIEATNSIRNCLFGHPVKYEFPPAKLNREGQGKGVLVGGNLSLLFAMSGTPDDIDTHGKILFLEDLDEYLYHIDRMMLNLKRSGKLYGLSGLVCGGFTEMKDNPIPFGKTAEEIILDAVHEYEFPVCFNFPAGHVNRNLALYLGRSVHLQVKHDLCSLNY